MENDSQLKERRGRQDAGRQALDAALRLLGRRDHTRRELAFKLKKRGFGQSDITTALDRCHALGYLDDAKTAMLLADHLADRGYGMLRIRHELGQRGLDDGLVEKALGRCGDEEDQVRHARRVLEKRRPRLTREADPVKRRQTAYRFLAGRGFPATVIRRAVGGFDGEW